MKIINPIDDKEFRKLAEQNKNLILLANRLLNKKDKLKQLSGINDVIAKIVSKSGSAVGIDLRELRSKDKIGKAIFLARLRELIKICRRNHTKIILSPKEKENFDLLISLGASTEQAKEATAQYF